MADKKSLRLTIAGNKDFAVLNQILFLLMILSSALSPQPIFLTALIVLLVAAGWIAPTLFFGKLNDREMTLVIFADGRISFRSDCGGLVEGFLDGQQWCTRRVSVLRVVTENKTRNLIVLSAQQDPGEYRRLNVWLRHGAILLLESEGRV